MEEGRWKEDARTTAHLAPICDDGAPASPQPRLQSAARGGDILLSDEAFRRVASWLTERGLTAEPEELELKGFDRAQPAYRLSSAIRA